MHAATSALPVPAAMPAGASSSAFARRRLHLGIAGVGASVVLSTAWLATLIFDLVPGASGWRLAPGVVGIPLTAGVATAVVFVTHALMMLPLEYLGGRREVRRVPSLRTWALAWARGVGLFTVLASASVAVLAVAGALGGTAAASAVAFGLSVALLIVQGPAAALVSGIATRPASDDTRSEARAAGVGDVPIRVAAVDDDAFVGGWIGFGPWRALWVPARWLKDDATTVRRVQWHRRASQWQSLARRRGWWRAAAWPAVGLAVLVPLLPFGWSDARMWLALPALATLWAFLGVLVLPSASRPAVFAADADAAKTLGVADVAAAMAKLDAWQDDERERDALVEFVFHPVPSVGNRLRALAASRRRPLGGGHQQARLTLYAGLATGSVLGRMVHCNIGRPALWVIYPGD